MKGEDLLRFCRTTSQDLRKYLFERREEEWGKKVKIGADGTPTSRVDQIAEEFILRKIEEEGLEVNVLSEEIGFLDRGSNVTLVLDPIDGTTNAIWGIPFYSVSMAFGKSSTDDVFFGYVYNLANGEEFYGIKGKGAFKGGKRISPKKGSPLGGFWINGEAIRNKDVIKRITRYLKGKGRILGAASLELCLVATGSLSFYYYPIKRLRIVDIAAGTLIVRESGGKVLGSDLSDLKVEFDLKERTEVLAISGGAL